MLDKGIPRRSLMRRTLVAQHLLVPRVPVEEDGGPDVGTDGPDAVYAPESAADFEALDIVAPTHLWLCQELSGNLAPTIGSLTLSGTGMGRSHDNAVAGWTRKFLGTTGGASGRWTTTDASVDIPLNGSVAVLVYAAVTNSGATRGVWGLANDEYMIAVDTSGKGMCRAGGGNATGSVVQFNDLTVVQPLFYVRDCVANTTRLYTLGEQINATHADTAASAGDQGLGGPGITHAQLRAGLAAMWFGATAEGLGKEVLTKLGWALAY